jgi:DNA repair protein RadC
MAVVSERLAPRGGVSAQQSGTDVDVGRGELGMERERATGPTTRPPSSTLGPSPLENRLQWGAYLASSSRSFLPSGEVHECARGGVASVPATPSDLFRAAVVVGSPAIILAHNHPSGDCSPSAEDHAFTTRVQDAGRLLGIQVLDHVVVCADGFHSFLDAGHMKSPVDHT